VSHRALCANNQQISLERALLRYMSRGKNLCIKIPPAICLLICLAISSRSMQFYYPFRASRSYFRPRSSFSFSSSALYCYLKIFMEARRVVLVVLYAVKYFSGISHVDPFTAASISLELSHFRSEISLRRSREFYRIWRYVSASSTLWNRIIISSRIRCADKTQAAKSCSKQTILPN